jgi:microtubule-associated protein-like 6
MDGAAPDADIDLEYVYGYRCHDVRNNLRYSSNGQELIYNAAAVGIVMDKAANKQTFFRAHNDDIHCLAIHPDPAKPFVATGQIGKRPALCVWNYETKEVVMRTTSPLIMGIKQVAFSPNGQYLAASAMDDSHNIAVYDWEKAPATGKTVQPVAAGKGPRANILSLGFNATSDQVVATCVKEVSFYTFSGGVIKGSKGSGWGRGGAETTTSQALVGNTLFTGLFSGEIAAWGGASISKRHKAHTQRVNALYSNPKDGADQLVSGGQDGKVIIWKATGTAL